MGLSWTWLRRLKELSQKRRARHSRTCMGWVCGWLGEGVPWLHGRVTACGTYNEIEPEQLTHRMRYLQWNRFKTANTLHISP